MSEPVRSVDPLTSISPRSKPSHERFFSLTDLAAVDPPKWLIHELVEMNSLTMVGGPPGSYKSFFALDWLLTLASGKTRWHDRDVIPSTVAYALGEGRTSLTTRIKAWSIHNSLTREQQDHLDHNFRVTFEVPQMAHRANVENMLRDLEKDHFRPEVLVIDTFARSFNGLDENSSKDTGLWIESAEYLRSLGFTVIFLHHTAKNTEFGYRYRGSSAILGAMDTAMTVVRKFEQSHITNKVELRVTKQKNFDEGDPMMFQACKLQWPESEEGSIVLVPDYPLKLNKAQEREAVREAMVSIITEFPNDPMRMNARRLSGAIGISEETAMNRIRDHIKKDDLTRSYQV